MKRHSANRIGIVLALLTGLSALAHDPYEISSTAYMRSNRLELYIEMEFRTAMLLDGVAPTAVGEFGEETVFETEQPRLRDRAGEFIQLSYAGNPISATKTNVTLELENHVRFVLEYPPAPDGAIGFATKGLKRLSEAGPYGTTLTVLDMVHQKVIGQEVLFADNPATEFTVAEHSDKRLSVANSNSAKKSDVSKPTISPEAAQVTATVVQGELPPKSKAKWWIWVLLGMLIVDIFIFLSWLSRKRSRG